MPITEKRSFKRRDESLVLIVQFVCSQQFPVSRTQIAKATGRKVAPGIIQQINDLVEWGYLVQTTVPYRTTGISYRFSPGQRAYDDGWCK